MGATTKREVAHPLTRPESAVLFLLEAVLSFDAATNYRKGDVVAKAFARQPAPIKAAIRKHWVVDHLPFYSAFLDLEFSEFERDLAERFWREISEVAERNYKPQQRRREATA